MRLQCKMPGVEELDLRVRYVSSKCLGAGGNEEGVILSPDCQQRRLGLAKVILKRRIEFQVRGVVEEQIELDVFVPRSFQQRRIQCVRFRRNSLRVGHAVRVLPSRSLQRQDVCAKDLPVLFCRLSPIFSDRTPPVAKALFIGVSVLRNDTSNSFWMRHRQPESRWRAVVENVKRETPDLKRLRERVHSCRQSIE